MEIDNGGFLGLGSETDMAECTYRFTREYMLGLLNQRAVHVVDGLSKLHRRILFVLRDKGRDTVYNLAGSVMQFHPSGDSSIAEGMTRMMQPWHHHNILFEPQGGVGGYSGEDAAAPRYLETTISQFTKDIFLPPRWERTVPMITNSKMRKEPDHFIPLLPGALLMGSNVTAKGFATKAPTYNLYDVCSLVMAFTEEILSKKHRKNADNYLESFARYMIPDPTSCCRVLNYKQQLKAIKNNNFQLPPIYEGVLEMGINHLAIRSLPPGYPFSKIDKTLKKLIVEKKPGHSVLQEINDESDAKSDLIWGKYR
ncbi:MAG: hypothetical protein GY804_08495, partial [Alphaproteobacteria bacterium]|nr:hypothetical protein [Alphaproteobacteria bacterium]